MALTQIQIIQSLGEAMNWLERELSWDVAIQEQRHLIGRIGELYAALMTGGQMAPEVNQSGYDVVSSSGERISVKTTTQQSNAGHLTFNANTLDKVDRIMVFYLNTEEMQIETLLDEPVKQARKLMSESGSKLNLPLGRLRGTTRKARSLDEQKVVAEATHDQFKITELESGTILVFRNGIQEDVTKPILRQISKELGLPLVNSNGNVFTTRQLGSRLIRGLNF